MHELIWFAAGAVTTVTLFIIWSRFSIRRGAKLLHGNEGVDAEELIGSIAWCGPTQRAFELKNKCKKRLQRKFSLNPSWIEPLAVELPKLVQEIATIYHPKSPDPLLAPPSSHFAKAAELAAKDIFNILTNKRIGRLIDVSAYQVKSLHLKANKIAGNNVFKFTSKVCGYIQVLRFKSPLMWASLIGRNIAVRSLQPAVVEIVAIRAIELYSGVFDVAKNEEV